MDMFLPIKLLGLALQLISFTCYNFVRWEKLHILFVNISCQVMTSN